MNLYYYILYNHKQTQDINVQQFYCTYFIVLIYKYFLHCIKQNKHCERNKNLKNGNT